MFSIEQYEHLHSLWDGGAENYSEVCHSCFACCDNTDKILYPGEDKYVQYKSKQFSSDWKSKDCMCKLSGVKLVFCKMYPMRVIVDLKGNWKYQGIEWECTSHNCKNLIFKESNFKSFLDFFFSDIHNILFHKIYTELGDEVAKLEKTHENQRLRMEDADLEYYQLLQSFYNLFELPYLDI